MRRIGEVVVRAWPGFVDHVHLVGRHRFDDVDAPRDQLGDLGGLLGDDPDADVLEGGLGSPVVLVSRQEVLLLLGPLRELVGTGADRVLLQPLVALLLDRLLGLDHLRREPLDEEGIGAIRLEAHGLGVHHLDALDLGVVATGGELVLGVQHAVEGGLHVLGPERCAVVELHTLPELDLPGRVVHVLPRHREARAHLAGLEVARGEVIEDVVAEDDALAEDGIGGIPGLDVALHGVHEGVVLGLGEDIRGCDQGEGQHESSSQRGDAQHRGSPSVSRVASGRALALRAHPSSRRRVPVQ